MPGSKKQEGEQEFVDGWAVAQTLGEGTFGAVKLLVNASTGTALAVKVVELQKYPEAYDEVKKEMALQNVTSHVNVLKYKGCRTDGVRQYMFLEYAAGGELYDRIEPDVGMPEDKARSFFRQLIAGVGYLHHNGMVHRDLKPENLLLDQNDVLKISDFGLATLFRFKGKERLLSRKCGTPPYIAPELYSQAEYQAEPIDLWACGVILCTMLAGEIPFDEPTENCIKFARWKCKSNELAQSPWNRLAAQPVSLMKKILTVNVRNRLILDEIRKNEWVLAGADEGTPNAPGKTAPDPPLPSFNAQAGKMPFFDDDQGKILAMSQPPVELEKMQSDVRQVVSFSQPSKPEHMLLSGDADVGSGGLQQQVRRMTRVMVNTTVSKTIERLEIIFTQNKYTYKSTFTNVMTVTTVDARGTNLIFKVTVIELGSNTLVDFRLSKGCGLDFKRQFLRCKEGLKAFIVDGPITWSMAHATNSLP